MSGSLQSQARLQFALSEKGQTILRRREAGGLCHLSKPYWNGKVLEAQLVNPTAGFFSGDEMGLTVELEKGAQVAISSPSANRFYDTAGGVTKVRQAIKIGKQAWLEYHTNWLVPQQGASVEQFTKIEVERGGSLMFCDRLAPGRVKFGEQYRYRKYQANFDLSYGGQLCASERMILEPDQAGWPLLVPGWDVCFYGVVWLIGHEIAKNCETFHGMTLPVNPDSLLYGATALGAHVIVIRLMAARSLLLKKAIDDIRHVSKSLFPILNHEPRILQSL